MQVQLAPECLHRTAYADQCRFAAFLGARNMFVMCPGPVFKNCRTAWCDAS